eukprot:13511307-Alexandrium_andersonii.AAC.1
MFVHALHCDTLRSCRSISWSLAHLLASSLARYRGSPANECLKRFLSARVASNIHVHDWVKC